MQCTYIYNIPINRNAVLHAPVYMRLLPGGIRCITVSLLMGYIINFYEISSYVNNNLVIKVEIVAIFL